jgi:catechol 2,3-dioxygenase-like lactoylglutathione lyase family enzyme
VKFAYGWVDLDTPGSLPLEVVVGEARDPLMLVCLRVSDLTSSVRFFTEQLGMRQLPFPLCRPAGSNFEPAAPKGSVFLGYGANTAEDGGDGVGLGVLLRPTVKGEPPLSIGSQLRGFTVVVDDSASALATAAYPAAVVKVLERYAAIQATEGTLERLLSPDGYPFIIKPLSLFQKESSRTV